MVLITKTKTRECTVLRLKVSGEKLSRDPTVVQPVLRKMDELKLLPNQIYNADESELFWKVLPDHTLVHVKETSTPGRKRLCQWRWYSWTSTDGYWQS
ncbi:hypothetical protein Trydic_g6011 [Trypoxylus dichotomus]